ncbi:carbohydrate ABC transporter permease [Thermanaerothrix sp. 4228-RoL]|uniref:Carbohydrate ABC transporter permease n=1 Tax=Thermanaerothrix solaris TaxID=3058434 RepID=A0ABU3NJK0_9CHLR|nr:carbohydrate ABC transporter permease [Thermanaerothrix sp. 4228-RoL]MDT8897035.1 carbohydrate ABC transporter permease [Thermanaerothrix sp. 4228-RoL]
MRVLSKRFVSRLLLYILVIIIVVWTVAPYLWLIISSFSSKIELLTVPLRWIPSRPTLENYRSLFFEYGEESVNVRLFIKSLTNSVIISLSTMSIATVLGVFAAYAIARLRFRGNQGMILTMMSIQLIPPIILVIPLYVIMRQAKLLDTHLGLIIVDLSIALPLVIWLMRSYFASIPSELEDAARIDGCTYFDALFRIVLPLSGPGLVSVMIFAFIASWNEYLYAFIYTNINAKTLPVLIGEFSTKLGLEYLKIAAAGVLASLPPVFLALIFQRFIIRGLTAGAIK